MNDIIENDGNDGNDGNDIDSRIKDALAKMHVYDREYNSISYSHTKDILQFLFERAPIDEKMTKSMLRLSIGISKRYITEYLDGLRAYGVIFRENGKIYTTKPIHIQEEQYKKRNITAEFAELVDEGNVHIKQKGECRCKYLNIIGAIDTYGRCSLENNNEDVTPEDCSSCDKYVAE